MNRLRRLPYGRLRLGCEVLALYRRGRFHLLASRLLSIVSWLGHLAQVFALSLDGSTMACRLLEDAARFQHLNRLRARWRVRPTPCDWRRNLPTVPGNLTDPLNGCRLLLGKGDDDND